ncbi:DUF6276 family protein [Halorussus gelatinilyticus]|uniref:DUF6276 family protein n=1 Tax=Halorussus gelatinilyticus TaxID=2937524 RepID=A0A8U0IMW0_9EURY|nr:DUF6276 family protein [Halorussus gelatinilyticus]UPW01926.1 DUF6276 family protein [Halorussus gelatinilyticus]
MTCPTCGSEQLLLSVPTDLRSYLPEASERVAVCTRCLALEPTDEESPDTADFIRISDAFPDGEAGVAMALAVGLLDSLALYRSEIAALLERVERAGTDPLLVLDRLDADAGVEPHFDVDRRRTQVEQLLYE